MDQKFQLVDFWKHHFKFRDREIKAFQSIRREDYISEKLKQMAYDDLPLPLLRGKTISQPTTVMMMISALYLQPGEKIFEVGTGSGYHASIIAKLVEPGQVITTEIMPELVVFSRQNIERAGITNIQVFEEDGSKGMPSKAPFDKIIITAACKEFPKELIEQLKPDGLIIGPVGDRNVQEMVLGTKDNDKLRLKFLGQFIFSPMHGKYGFEI